MKAEIKTIGYSFGDLEKMVTFDNASALVEVCRRDGRFEYLHCADGNAVVSIEPDTETNNHFFIVANGGGYNCGPLTPEHKLEIKRVWNRQNKKAAIDMLMASQS